MIICGDSAEVLKTIESESIDMVLTSPPYDNLRTYNGFVFDFETIANELKRVLKPGGVIVWVVGDATIDGSETGTSLRQSLYFLSLGLKLYDTMIYAKKNPMPLNCKRYEQQFEYMFVFTKGKPNTVNLILDECKHAGGKSMGTTYDKDGKLRDAYKKAPIKDKKPRTNIRYYGVGGKGIGHPAIFPEQLAIDHIKSRSNEGDTILDPFAGSGTTLKAAKLLNRNFIGIEISQEYVDIATERLANCQNTLL